MPWSVVCGGVRLTAVSCIFIVRSSISSTRRIPIRRSASGGSGRIGLRRTRTPSANRPVGPMYAAASGAVCEVRRNDNMIRVDTER